MRVLRYTDSAFERHIKKLNRKSIPDPKVRDTVAQILADIESHGDAALLKYSEKFGGPKLTAKELYVTSGEMAIALAELPGDIERAILAARENVAAFAKRSLRKSWSMRNRQGAVVGERFDPFRRVGIYIPGGTAPLISTAVMTCTLAMTAGVPEIVAVTPARADGSIHPALLAALSLCGATEVYRVGGAQAVAALAIGTKTIPSVQKIFGPGNAYVVEAKRQAFGRVGVDLIPGPSEVLVIADKTGRPDWIAADLLAQCEHGHGSIGILVTDSSKLLVGVEREIEKQVAISARKHELKSALKNTALILVKTMDQAIGVANDFACEHVSIATKDPERVAAELTTSGAVFLGGISPVVAGDFLAGPSHELPTGGAGKAFAGLTVDQFQRRTSIVRYDKESLARSMPYLQTFSTAEGLDAHGRSAAVRLS